MTGYGGRGTLRRSLGDDEDGDEEEDEFTLGPGNKRVAPDGQYRVLGTDNWAAPTDPDWVVGDYDSKQEALRVAREKNTAAAGGKVLDPGDERIHDINRYYVYDDTGAYVGGDIHHGE